MLRNRTALQPATNGGEVKVHSGKLSSKYSHRLSFYDRPPGDEVTVEEFETFGMDRLRILAEIEACHARNRNWEEIRNIINARLKSYLPLSANSARTVDLEAERRKDLISHYVLRLAVCRTQDLRFRFLKHELTLFRIRWDSDDLTERDAFLKSLGLDWQDVSNDEKQRLKNELIASSPHLRDLRERFDSESYYKVHWTRVLDLVEKRRVYLSKGWAYVPAREQASLVFAEFSARLEKALEMTARALPRLDEDDRLIPVLDHLSQGLLSGVTSEYVQSVEGEDLEEIKAEQIDGLSRNHFPMCMRHMHDTLREKHKLKHQGRLQYGLFLKAIGLPVNEALAYFRKGFNTTTDDKWQKDYIYNIKHNYGLVGGMKQYPPKSCQSILTKDLPGPQDDHGCPFRHFNKTALSAALNTSYPRLTGSEQKEILDASEATHYHVACTRLFECSHGIKKGDGIGSEVGVPNENVTHPNAYFKRSRELEKLRSEGKKDAMDIDA